MNPNKIKEQGEEFQEEAEGTTFRERALQWKQTATDGVVNFARTTDTYVHENPWPTIGMTALFAFALGILVGNRRR